MRFNLTDTHTSDEVVIAQLDAFKRRVPILYGVLIVNTIAMAVTHIGLVGSALTIYAPAIFCTFMSVRMVYGMRLPIEGIDLRQARRQLAHTTVLAIALALLIPIWALTLYICAHELSTDLGGINHCGQTALYIGLTAVSCTTLLMHSRIAATLVALFVTGPFCTYLLVSGSLVERAVSLNLILIAAAILYVLFAFAREFEVLVQSKHDLKHMGDQQAYLANTDLLTRLSSRLNFFTTLEGTMRSAQPFALMMIDLDGFKQVNDLHGHLVGDEVLVEIGRRLDRTLEDRVCLARIGGDEFAVIQQFRQPELTLQQARQVVEACTRPIAVKNNIIVTVGASIGISLASRDNAKLEQSKLIEQADYALFHVKQNGKGRVQIFEPAHERAVRRHGEVEQALRGASLASEISLVYQPVALSNSGEVIGFEALARWHSPLLGQVSPAEFVPAAERSGLIGSLTLTVLDQALTQLKIWPDWVRLKINLSAHDVSSAAQMLLILAAVKHSGVQASRLTFELTETALGSDLDAVSASVDMLKAMGAAIAIDDFGTGYSSLSYVHRFNPDLIKIDRSFTMRLGETNDSTAIIKTVIELCRNIGARSLAEGVETADQALALTRLGVDEFQGYFYGRPMPAGSLDELLVQNPVYSAA